MDLHQPQDRGRSPSAAGAQSQPQLQPPINSRRSPSPAGFAIPNENDPSSSNAGNPNSAIGLGLGLEASPHQFHDQSAFPNSYDLNVGAGGSFLNAQQTTTSSFSQSGLVNATTASFDLGQDFTSQLSGDDPSFGGPTEGGYSQSLLNPNFGDSDFTIFPPTTGEQFGSSLFLGDVQQQQLGTPENNMLPSSRPHSPTLPHLLKAEPSSANHSPSFNQHQFSSSPGRHSRNVSLGPEAALLPHQIDWTQAAPQFQGHRRTPSEYSDVSSVAPSPHLVSSDNFDPIDQNHSPMQQPQDMGLYNELHGISNFSISDHGAHSPNHHAGRSPSHSPAISPRLVPQSMPDVSQHNPYILQPQDNNNNYGQPPPNPYDVQTNEAFPVLNTTSPEGQMQMQAPPAINIDYAPPATRTGFDQAKSIDADSLTPPDRGLWSNFLSNMACYVGTGELT
ncbi:hypothetical protein VTK73DRAFT_4743 [Phialemonium thermophilum]|uniref:Uncharacterized protein n=1 Tax=Phialemonium thermophilum TaxID=223376 RepID=A0ABR3V6A3_9PEZI